MELNFSTLSPTACDDEHVARRTATIVADSHVARFVAERRLQADFTRVLNRIDGLFSPETITVEWVASQEENGEGEDRLLFIVQCDMDRERFQANTDIFFEPLRKEKPPIYFLMGLHRDV